MAVADLADALEVPGHRRHRPERRPDHRLGDEGGDRLRPQFQDRGVQLVGGAAAVFLFALSRFHAAVGIAGRYMGYLGEHRLIGRPAGPVAAHRKRAQGIAVEALAAGDETCALGPAGLEEILARHLQGRLHRLGSAGHVVHPFDSGGRPLDQDVRQRLGRFRREEPGVGEGQLVDLFLDGAAHVGVAVPEAGDGGAAGGVEVAFARPIDDVNALAAHRRRQVHADLALKDAAHDWSAHSRPEGLARFFRVRCQ